MDLKLIDTVIATYDDRLDEGDKARLAFFRKLWGIQELCKSELEDKYVDGDGYKLPSSEELSEALHERRPIFSVEPVNIDLDILCHTLDQLTEVFTSEDLFLSQTNDAFDRVKWDRVVKASDIARAGSNPSVWLEDFCSVLIDDGMSEDDARLGTVIASMALKVQLEDPSKVVMEAITDIETAGLLSPLLCPVCGSAPMMAHVGGVTSSSGRGKLLVCPQCAATWEFERVRCTRCGTQNQGHLHFYNIEGDDDHRIATCDECGGYIRTLYSEDTLSLCSYEVEDVVMARLDAVAQNPRIAHGENQDDNVE